MAIELLPFMQAPDPEARVTFEEAGLAYGAIARLFVVLHRANPTFVTTKGGIGDLHIYTEGGTANAMIVVDRKHPYTSFWGLLIRPEAGAVHEYIGQEGGAAALRIDHIHDEYARQLGLVRAGSEPQEIRDAYIAELERLELGESQHNTIIQLPEVVGLKRYLQAGRPMPLPGQQG